MDCSDNSENSIYFCFLDACSRNMSLEAVIQGDVTLRYGELLSLVNKISDDISGRFPDNPPKYAVLQISRSPIYIAVVLALVKLGITYVPLGKNFPRNRVDSILASLGGALIIKDSADSGRGCVEESVVFDESRIDGNINSCSVNSDQAVYAIFTSGTTGEPKGVAVGNPSISNMVSWHISRFSLQPGRRVSFIANLGFDASVWEMWPALCSGSSLVLPEVQQENSVTDLIDFLENTDLYQSFMVTPLVELAIKLGKVNKGVRYLLTGGDKLRTSDLSRLPDGVTLVNNYGPTEATVLVTSEVVRSDSMDTSVGYPIDNCKISIIGSNGNILGFDTIGEIGISGICLAIGYINNPYLTEEKFININGERIYLSGDLGWLDSSGRLHFYGRLDSQIKVAGNRIELAEIEAQILRFPGVLEACACHTEEGAIVAFVESENSSVSGVLEYIRESLPEYSIPSRVILVDKILVSINGKIDRKAMLDLYNDMGVTFDPSSSLELAVSEAWVAALLVDEVLVDKDFFACGGDSLKVVIFELELERRGLSFSFHNSVYKYPNIKQFCKHGVQEDRHIANVSQIDNVSMPKNMKDALEYDPDFYVSAVFEINGRSIDDISRALNLILARHSAFSIFIEDGTMRFSDSGLDSPVDVIHLDDGDLDLIIRDLNSVEICLSKAPMCAFTIIELGNSVYLHAKISHLISDGWSVRSIESDLNADQISLQAPCDSQFLDYAKQNTSQVVRIGPDIHGWWLRALSGAIDFPLFGGKQRLSRESSPGKYVGYIEKDVADLISSMAIRNVVTDYAFLLSVFSLIVSESTNCSRFYIMTTDNSRGARYKDSVGYYMNVLPIVVSISSDEDVIELSRNTWTFLKDAKSNSGMSNGDLYGLLKSENVPNLYGSPCNAFFQLHKSFGYDHNKSVRLIPKYSVPDELNEDLCLDVFPTPVGYELHWTYCKDVFSEYEISNINKKFQKIVLQGLSCVEE